jgi:hypothetical protein
MTQFKMTPNPRAKLGTNNFLKSAADTDNEQQVLDNRHTKISNKQQRTNSKFGPQRRTGSGERCEFYIFNLILSSSKLKSVFISVRLSIFLGIKCTFLRKAYRRK